MDLLLPIFHFSKSDQDSYATQPISKDLRKDIHSLCEILNLSSKSDDSTSPLKSMTISKKDNCRPNDIDITEIIHKMINFKNDPTQSSFRTEFLVQSQREKVHELARIFSLGHISENKIVNNRKTIKIFKFEICNESGDCSHVEKEFANFLGINTNTIKLIDSNFIEFLDKKYPIPLSAHTIEHFWYFIKVHTANQQDILKVIIQDALSMVMKYGGVSNCISEFNRIKNIITQKLKAIGWKNTFDKCGTLPPNYAVYKRNTNGTYEYYISLDIRTANATTCRLTNPKLLDDCKDWNEYMSKITDVPFIIKSKMFRQTVLGSWIDNKQFASVQKYLMSVLYEKLKNGIIDNDNIFQLGSDEMLIRTTFQTIKSDNEKITECLNSLPNNMQGIWKCVPFCVKSLPIRLRSMGNDFIVDYRVISNLDNLNPQNYPFEVKTVGKRFYLQAYKYILNQEITIDDLRAQKDGYNVTFEVTIKNNNEIPNTELENSFIQLASYFNLTIEDSKKIESTGLSFLNKNFGIEFPSTDPRLLPYYCELYNIKKELAPLIHLLVHYGVDALQKKCDNLRDSICDAIKNTDVYKELDKKRNLCKDVILPPNSNIYSKRYNEYHYFLKVKLIDDDFTSHKFYNPNLVLNYNDWTSLTSQFENGHLFVNATKFKKSIFAKAGKSKLLQEYCTAQFYDTFKEIEELGYMVEFLYRQEKTCEMIITSCKEDIGRDIELVNKHFGSNWTCEPFCLKSIGNTPFFERRDIIEVDMTNLNDSIIAQCPLKIENIDLDFYPQAYKYVLGVVPIVEEDLKAMLDGVHIKYDTPYQFV